MPQSRVETLSPSEYKVVLAMREATTALQTKTASPDVMIELESIYHELQYVSGTNWEEVTRDVAMRIYGLLR